MGWTLSSGVEAKIVAKKFVISDGDEITSRRFMIVGTDALPLLRIRLGVFQNSRDPSRLLLTFDCLCINALCIFYKSLSMDAGSSECS